MGLEFFQGVLQIIHRQGAGGQGQVTGLDSQSGPVVVPGSLNGPDVVCSLLSRPVPQDPQHDRREVHRGHRTRHAGQGQGQGARAASHVQHCPVRIRGSQGEKPVHVDGSGGAAGE